MNMFCFQCQQTALNKGCTISGVCGKEPQTSAYMDLLLYTIKGIAIINSELRKKEMADPIASRFILKSLFMTITNANFDDVAICNRIDRAFKIKNELAAKAKKHEITLPSIPNVNFDVKRDDYAIASAGTGVLMEEDEDIRSLKEFVMYGAKGAAAYAKHALHLGFEDPNIYEIIETSLSEISRRDISVDELLSIVINIGDCSVKAMALLDKAHTSTYGQPIITHVKTGVKKNPGILVTGHDLRDLKELLDQSKGSGVDIYTHGEMLPAHYYPAFKKYSNFAGNYGGSWWQQREEFEKFNGCILFTTNCIVPPHKEASYKDRIYTTGSAGLHGATYISRPEDGSQKDFSKLINAAKTCKPPIEIDNMEIIGGFAHNQIESKIDDIVKAIKNGTIKRFVVMAGCDGRDKTREYYTDFAKLLPKDNIILTAGCAKFRYNKLALGDIGGIPRVLDAGQCNDCYSIIKTAIMLRDKLGCKDINDIPVIYNIAWFEQKAVAVLLALLALGVKKIHLGPTLPAFASKKVIEILNEKFELSGIEDFD